MASRGFCAALLLTVVGAAGCEDVSGDWLPLDVGNRWEYRVVRPGGQRESEFRYQVRVVEPVGVGGKTFRTAESEGERIWSKEAGFVAYSSSRETSVLLALPPYSGRRWTSETSDGERYFCEIVGREDVEVPAGRFDDCVRVKMEHENARTFVHLWFGRDVGIVKRVIEIRGRAAVAMELVHFDLNPEGGRKGQ